MKRIHIEAGILSILYIASATIAINSFETDNAKITYLFTYPAKIILKPIINDFNIESLNLSLFTAYFLWSFNCIYMIFIKKTILNTIGEKEE